MKRISRRSLKAEYMGAITGLFCANAGRTRSLRNGRREPLGLPSVALTRRYLVAVPDEALQVEIAANPLPRSGGTSARSDRSRVRYVGVLLLSWRRWLA